MFQEATHLLYDDSRVVYGKVAEVYGAVSRDWIGTLSYLIVPAAWLMVWCARSLWSAFVASALALILFLVWGLATEEVFGRSGGGAYWWTGGPGRGVAGFFESKAMLWFLHDPARHLGSVLLPIGLLAWPALMIGMDFRNLTAKETSALPCDKCDYDLRGTPTSVCPECGHDQRDRSD
ncbi:MAG: hypothetical protein AAGA29_02025 [Planctomycetota bacterium]